MMVHKYNRDLIYFLFINATMSNIYNKIIILIKIKVNRLETNHALTTLLLVFLTLFLILLHYNHC